MKISETRDYRELYAYALAPGVSSCSPPASLLGATRLRSVPMSFAWPLVLLLGVVLVPLAPRALLARHAGGARRELRAFGEPAVLARGSTPERPAHRAPARVAAGGGARARACSRSRARSSASGRRSWRGPAGTCWWCSISRAR